jgi:hypothetical protein
MAKSPRSSCGPGSQMKGGTWPFLGGTLTLLPVTMNLGVASRPLCAGDRGDGCGQAGPAHGPCQHCRDGRIRRQVPLVFDENGGTIEAGKLHLAPPGGNLSYVGELTYKDLSPMANFAFDTLKSLDYRQMASSSRGRSRAKSSRASSSTASAGGRRESNFLTGASRPADPLQRQHQGAVLPARHLDALALRSGLCARSALAGPHRRCGPSDCRRPAGAAARHRPPGVQPSVSGKCHEASARLTGLRGLRQPLRWIGRKAGNRWQGRRARCAAAVLVAATMALSGCISVTAPDKPIVIELNINIKQEVIYRLAADAATRSTRTRTYSDGHHDEDSPTRMPHPFSAAGLSRSRLARLPPSAARSGLCRGARRRPGGREDGWLPRRGRRGHAGAARDGR